MVTVLFREVPRGLPYGPAAARGGCVASHGLRGVSRDASYSSAKVCYCTVFKNFALAHPVNRLISPCDRSNRTRKSTLEFVGWLTVTSLRAPP